MFEARVFFLGSLVSCVFVNIFLFFFSLFCCWSIGIRADKKRLQRLGMGVKDFTFRLNFAALALETYFASISVAVNR